MIKSSGNIFPAPCTKGALCCASDTPVCADGGRATHLARASRTCGKSELWQSRRSHGTMWPGRRQDDDDAAAVALRRRRVEEKREPPEEAQSPLESSKLEQRKPPQLVRARGCGLCEARAGGEGEESGCAARSIRSRTEVRLFEGGEPSLHRLRTGAPPRGLFGRISLWGMGDLVTCTARFCCQRAPLVSVARSLGLLRSEVK